MEPAGFRPVWTQEKFNAMDTNGDGMIDEQEALAAGMTIEEFQALDRDKNGRLDFSECIDIGGAAGCGRGAFSYDPSDPNHGQRAYSRKNPNGMRNNSQGTASVVFGSGHWWVQ